MSGREQEPWQRRVRQSREQSGWNIAPAVEPPRRPKEPETPADARIERPSAPPTYTDESVWSASASFGKLIGFVLSLTTLALALISFLRFRAVDGVESALALAASIAFTAAAVAIIYILRGLGTIRYVIGRDTLAIYWMNQRHVVRFEDIQDVVYEPRGANASSRYERFWPGYHVSTMRMADGVWHSVATQPPNRRIRVTSAAGIHAISPRRPILFLGELARRRQQYVSGGVEPTSASYDRGGDSKRMPSSASPEPVPPTVTAVRPAPVTLPASQEQVVDRKSRTSLPRRGRHRFAIASVTRSWNATYRELFRERLMADHIASGLIAVGVMVPLLMVAFLYSQYEGIGAVVPLHWDAHGDVDSVGSRRDLWRLPLIATLILMLNTTLATVAVALDRFMARFLVAMTPAAQGIVFIALIHAVT
jgi:hypothetical protein